MEVGIDCVALSRFQRDIASKKAILSKIFTEREITYCESKAHSYQHYAVRFAGKEAVIKAFSCYGIKLLPKQIEIANNKNGVPFVTIVNTDDFDVKISLSHSEDTAVAIALIVNKSE